jgi:hypothetical protein
MTMNYILLIGQFWRLRRTIRITSKAADLYFFLLQECNAGHWKNPFSCTNKLIIATIDIREPTLIAVRKQLKRLGLIDFKPGRRNEAAPVYQILYLNNLSNAGVELKAMKTAKGEMTAEHFNKTKRNQSIKERKVYIEIGSEEMTVTDLKNAFLADQGLINRWKDTGLPADDFHKGIERFLDFKNGSAYANLKQFRDNFYFWIPKHYNELNKKNNGTTTSYSSKNDRVAAGAAKPGISRSRIDALREW